MLHLRGDQVFGLHKMKTYSKMASQIVSSALISISLAVGAIAEVVLAFAHIACRHDALGRVLSCEQGGSAFEAVHGQPAELECLRRKLFTRRSPPSLSGACRRIVKFARSYFVINNILCTLSTMDAQSTLFDRKRKRDDTDHRTKKKRRRTREKQRKARENEAESSTKPALHNDSAHGSMPQTVNKDKIVGSDSSVRLATEKKEEQSSGREKKRRRKSKPTAPGLPALSSHVDEASKDGSTQDTFNAADEADAPRAGKQRKKRRRKNPLRSLVKDEHGQTPELNGVSSSVQALSSNVQDIQRSSEIGKVEATEDSKKSKRKKKRKGSVTSSIDPLSGAEVDLVDIKHRKEVSNELPPHTSAWTVINPTAGRMLEQAACFSSDERFVDALMSSLQKR